MGPLARGAFAVIAVFLTILSNPAHAIPLSQDVIASTTDGFSSVPGVTFRSFGDAGDFESYIAVDGGGGVIFQGAGITEETSRGFTGIFSVDSGSSDPTALVTSGQDAPGGGTFSNIDRLAANDASTVAFFSGVRGIDDEGGVFTIGGDGGISRITTGFSNYNPVGVTAANEVIFVGTTDSKREFEGLHIAPIDGGPIQTVAIFGQEVPEVEDGTFGFPDRVTANANGDLTFFSDVFIGDSGDQLSDGLFHTRDGVTQFVGHREGPAPDLPEGAIWEPKAATVGPSGELLVIAEFEVDPDIRERPKFGVWHGNGPDDLQLVTQGEFGAILSSAFGPDGKVFFPLEVDGREIFLTFDPGNIEVDALLDNETDTPFGRLRFYDPVDVTNDGTIIFFADDTNRNEGFYALEEDGTLTALIRKGDEIDGKTVTSLTRPEDGQSAFNGRTLAVIADVSEGDASGEAVLRIVLDSDTPTNFVWTGTCNSTNWHDTACAATNWRGADGEPVTAPPGDATAGDENATITAAPVQIADRAVTLGTLTATGQLTLDNQLTLSGASTIENINIRTAGELVSNGETTLTGDGTWQEGKIKTQGEGIVINIGTLGVTGFPPALLDGVLRNEGTVNQSFDLGVTGRVENKNIWNLDSAKLTEPTPGGGSFDNDGALINVSGNSTLALAYVGGNGSTIVAQAADSELILTGGGAFVGATTMEVGTIGSLGLKASVELNGAGPEKTVYTVIGTIETDTEPAVAGGLTVRSSTSRGGDFIIGANAALNVTQGSKLLVAGADLVLNGGDLTGRVETFTFDLDFLGTAFGSFDFLAGRLGVAGDPATRADVVIGGGSILNIIGETAANRSLAGQLNIRGTAVQETNLKLEDGAITVDGNGSWNLQGGNLLTDDDSQFINNGTLTNVSGNSTMALDYAGGNGSTIVAQAADSELILTGGGAFVGATTMEVGTIGSLGLKASVELNGAGPEKTVYTVIGTIGTDTEPAVAGALTVRNSTARVGEFVIGPNAALNVAQDSRLFIEGANLVLKGGDLTGRIGTFSFTVGPQSVALSSFDFLAGRLGVAGDPATRADVFIGGESVLNIIGQTAEDRSVAGKLRIQGRVVQESSLQIENSAIIINPIGIWDNKGGAMLSDAESTLTVNILGGFRLDALDPENTTVTFNGVLDNLGIVEVRGGGLNFDGAVTQLIDNVLTDGDELTGGTWRVVGGDSMLRIGNASTIDRIGADAHVILKDDGAINNLDLINNAGQFELINTDLTTTGGMINTGMFSVTEGSAMIFSDTYNNNDGELTIGVRSRLRAQEYLTNEGSKTTIDGRLEITGSETTVLSGNLSGSGVVSSIEGVRTVAALINAGNSPGTLTFDTPLFVAGPDTVFHIEVGGTEAGTEFDLLMFTGNVVLGGMLVFDFIDGFLPDTADLFKFFEVAGELSGQFDQITVNGLGDNADFDVIVDPLTGEIILADVVAAIIGVPEPSTLGLLVVGLFSLGWARRRRVAR